MSSLYSVLFLFLLSLSSTIISGIILFGDGIVFYLQIHLIHSYAPHLLQGIPGLSEPDANGNYKEITYSQLFTWAVIQLSIRALFLNILMVKLCWKERRCDYLYLGMPLAGAGGWVGSYALTKFGRSPYLPYVFAVTFGTFAAAMIVIRIRRTWLKNQEKEIQDIERAKNDKKNKELNEITNDGNNNNQQVEAPVKEIVVGGEQQQVETSSEDENEDKENKNTENQQLEQEKKITIYGIPHATSRDNFCSTTSRDDLMTSPVSTKETSHKNLSRSASSSKIAEIEKQIEEEKKAIENAPPKIDPEDQAKLNDPEYISKTRKWFTFACFFSGFTGGIANIASLPIVCVSIWFNFPKTLSRGTNNFIFLACFIVRCIYNSQSGEVDLSNSVPETVAVVSGGLLALLIGNKLAAKLTSDQFILIVTCMLLLAALTLGNAPSEVVLAVMILEMIYFSWENGRSSNN